MKLKGMQWNARIMRPLKPAVSRVLIVNHLIVEVGMKRVLVLALLLNILLFGCATTQKIALNEDIRISSISVSENVIIPDDIFYVGGGSAFGIVGAIANISSAKAFQEYAVKNGIDIKDIVRNTFIETFKETIKYSYSDNAKHQINLEVKVYGVSKESLFSDKYEPILLVQAEMKDQADKIIWKNGHYIQALGNPIEPVSMEKIKEDPQVLKKLWTDAARAASIKILEHL
jgi:hypothetical protein